MPPPAPEGAVSVATPPPPPSTGDAEPLDLSDAEPVADDSAEQPRAEDAGPPSAGAPDPADASDDDDAEALDADALEEPEALDDEAFELDTSFPPPPPDASGARSGPLTPPPAPPASDGTGAAADPAELRPWFETFFNDDYLRTVRPPTPREVGRECDFIEALFEAPRGATILDVGCGLGLHAIELTRRGYLVVGLDLSLPMLSRAADEAQDEGLLINFLHGDMRDMTFGGSFDAVLCWGTSFGYFEEAGNRQALDQIHAAVKPGGKLLLDIVNRDHVIREQPNLVWFEGDGCVCMEESRFDYFQSRLHVKRTVILDDGRQRESHYGLRLYAPHEIGTLLSSRGFRTKSVSGRMATPGVFFGADSPRMTILAERRSGATSSSDSLPAVPADDEPSGGAR